jgi:hypothetical protein
MKLLTPLAYRNVASIICRQPSKGLRAIPAWQSRAASCYTTTSSASALGHRGAVHKRVSGAKTACRTRSRPPLPGSSSRRCKPPKPPCRRAARRAISAPTTSICAPLQCILPRTGRCGGAGSLSANLTVPLDHVVVLGERHLRHLLANYATYLQWGAHAPCTRQGYAAPSTGADSRAYRISHLARRSPSALRSDGIIGRHRHRTLVHKPLTMILFSYVINIPLH